MRPFKTYSIFDLLNMNEKRIGSKFFWHLFSVYSVKGTKIRPDPMSKKNEKRRKFCSKYDGYEDFCEGKLELLFLNA